MSVTAAKGFFASGLASGIKGGDELDLALVGAQSGVVSAAAVFTTNRAAAAPVLVSRQHLDVTGGSVAAVILNSGCANAATGEAGMDAATASCEAVARALGVDVDEVLVCSTGLIGIPLPVEKILASCDALVESRGESPEDGERAARAIMTTDTHPKQVVIDGDGFVIGGMVKGAGMIGPNMATMLAVLTTDAEVTPNELGVALRIAVADTFNELVVDGCTSTNDTVIVLSSGLAGPVAHGAFVEALTRACREMAEQLAEDAEGTTRVAEINVVGARTEADARLAARRVATSLLVKTSLFGADPYWGRVLSELGASGAALEPSQVTIAYGPTIVCSGGVEATHDKEAVSQYLSARRVEVTCSLGLGHGQASVLTTDLGHGYIDENMRTS